MHSALSLLLLLAAAGGSSPTPTPEAPRSSSALLVTIHRAYRYTGTGYLTPDPGTQLIAVDIEFSGATDGLDLDDVEIIDAVTNVVLDAAPEAAFLNPDGSFFSWRNVPPSGLRRCLLVFQVPKHVKVIRLQHWGESLTKRPIKVRRSGPTLPAEHPGA